MHTNTSCSTYEKMSEEKLREEKQALLDEIQEVKKKRESLKVTLKNLEKQQEDAISGNGPKNVDKEVSWVGLILSVFIIIIGASLMPVLAVLGVAGLFFSAYTIYTNHTARPYTEVLAETIANTKTQYETVDAQLNTLNARYKSLPSYSALHSYERNLEIAKLFGISKREKMAEQERAINSAAREYLESSINKKVTKAGEKLGYKEQETNWAVMGGIAAGIAGPIAGAVNALSIQAEEKARAAKMHKEGEAILASTISDLRTLQSVRGTETALSREIAHTSSLSVIPNIPVDEILDNINCSFSIANPYSLLLEICGSISWNKKLPSLRSGEKYAIIDGTLQVEIRDGSTLIGTAYIPLPLEGLAFSKSVTVSGFYLLPQAEPTKKYTICLSKQQNLWVLKG